MRRLGPVLEFMRALWALDHALQSASKRMETRLGVTAPQRLVVRIVGRFPGISAGEVAEILHVHPSTLTGVLKRLEARGIVTRRADPKDARRALLALTARGRELDRLRSGTVEAVVRRVLQRLPSGSVRSVRALAEALTAALDMPPPQPRSAGRGRSGDKPAE
jgi:DNA-binding MarR family transcriptional regulator